PLPNVFSPRTIAPSNPADSQPQFPTRWRSPDSPELPSACSVIHLHARPPCEPNFEQDCVLRWSPPTRPWGEISRTHPPLVRASRLGSSEDPELAPASL